MPPLLPRASDGTPPTPPHADGSGFFQYHGIWAPGVRAFRHMRFMSKAAIISLAFMLPLLALVGWLLMANFNNTMQERKDATRQHVEVAHGVLAWAHAQEQAGTLTREQAQEQALRLIEQLRYERQEYFWINDMHPRMVMHPFKPELNGQDVSGFKDPNGLALFNAFVDMVRSNGKGFVPYKWPKPGSDVPVDKVSYVLGFAPWGWVIGSGMYVDDVHQILLRRLAWVGLCVLITLAVAGYLFLSFYRVMDGGLRETRRHLRAMTDGDLTTSPEPWGSDEAADLMVELHKMQDALRNMVWRVRRSGDEIVHTATEIASGAMDLSRRTEAAAASLEESAASMEEIASTVNNSTEHVQEASQRARHNAEMATDGGRVMQEVVQTMEGIRASSAKIAEIIATIDGIAFQTGAGSEFAQVSLEVTTLLASAKRSL